MLSHYYNLLAERGAWRWLFNSSRIYRMRGGESMPDPRPNGPNGPSTPYPSPTPGPIPGPGSGGAPK